MPPGRSWCERGNPLPTEPLARNNGVNGAVLVGKAKSPPEPTRKCRPRRESHVIAGADTNTYRERGFARAVGTAAAGSSGQGCRGYRPRKSDRTAG